MSERWASLQGLWVVGAAVALVVAGFAWADRVVSADTTPGWPRYVEILTDPVTGCQYIGRAGQTAWTPRLGTDGKPMCGEAEAR